MAYIIDKREGSLESPLPPSQANYEYKYPRDLDLKPGSDTHKKIVDMLIRYANESSNEMKGRYNSWSAIDKFLTAFVSPETLVAAKKDKKKDIPVVVPITYATMETLLTYMVAVFLNDVIFRYKGIGGKDDAVGAALLEHVVNIHCQKTKVGLNLHTQWRDMFAYGLGVVTPTWVKRMGRKAITKKGQGLYDFMGRWIPLPDRKTKSERGVVFEGNALENIDPYCYLPDPNVAVCDVQRSEYQGWVVRTNRLEILSDERASDGDIFNAKYLRHITGRSTFMEEGRQERIKAVEDKARGSTGVHTSTRPMDILYMYVNLIPEEAGLGRGDYPEKWLFALVGNEVLIQAKPLGLDHERYPLTVCSSTTDGYTATPISCLEEVAGLQDTLDWLFTSHIANVRKAVNDMIVYDPQLIYSGDLRNPAPGKLIRMRKQAWGRGLENAIKQLDVKDVTRGNIDDAGFILDIIQRVSGASDMLQGIMRAGGERRSATEFRETKMGAASRLEKMAKLVSMQSMVDIAEFFAEHTQQLMKEEVYIKITGEWEVNLREEYGVTEMEYPNVSPSDLAINYDVLFADGSVPGGEYADSWVSLFQILSKSEYLLPKFDMVRIFKHIARKIGAKNITDFEIKSKTAPTEQIAGQVDKGNLIPVEAV